MFLEITQANYINDYKLSLMFNDGTETTVDLENELNGTVFEPLKDKSKFKKFSIVFNTIEWENGADFAPEYLYELALAQHQIASEQRIEYGGNKKKLQNQKNVPTLSMFFGIIIRMYYAPKEHNPPHIHVYYQDFKALINIVNFEKMDGDLPVKQSRLVLAWIEIHKEELMANWELCQNGEKPFVIEPLK